jgi:hypothetical protein
MSEYLIQPILVSAFSAPFIMTPARHHAPPHPLLTARGVIMIARAAASAADCARRHYDRTRRRIRCSADCVFLH